MTGQALRYGAEGGPLAIAHRGGAGLAPENTIRAFATAYALGYRYLETDVRLTLDGELVAFHDHRVDRVTGGAGRVSDYSLTGLRQLRVDGEQIPTLREVLETFPDARFIVDLKDLPALTPLATLLRDGDFARRVCVAGAWDGWLTRLRREVPEVTTALGWRGLSALVSCARTGVRPRFAPGGTRFAHVPLSLGRVPVFAERLVSIAHDHGIRIICWTVDDPTQMHRLRDAGVDGIITDRPDVLREVLIARGEWTPMPTVGRVDLA